MVNTITNGKAQVLGCRFIFIIAEPELISLPKARAADRRKCPLPQAGSQTVMSRIAWAFSLWFSLTGDDRLLPATGRFLPVRLPAQAGVVRPG
jgi:hypothetical protein